GFRVMVGTGILMLIVSWSAAFFLKRRRNLPKPLALIMVPMALSGQRRQPWLVTGILKTADAVGPVAGSHVALTLAVYLILYVLLLIAYLGVLVHLALKAAKEGDTSPLPGVMNAAMSQPAAGE
ncbi:MAG: cytochrome ubiquinol oxidase subunit I, partial [Mesorhizobium sp.]